MIQHTHDKTVFAVIIRRTVQFMARPALTRQKSYREPVIVKKKRYRSKAEAEIAANHWERKLI